MKTYVYIYNNFAQFEIIIPTYLMKTVGEIITFSISNEPVTSIESFKIIPDKTIKEISEKIDEIDCIIIPGGDIDLEYSEPVKKIIQELVKRKKIVAGICSGISLLYSAGVLENRQVAISKEYFDGLQENENFITENVCVDENIITSKASGYVEFGIRIGEKLNIYKDQNDLNETIDFFREFKS